MGDQVRPMRAKKAKQNGFKELSAAKQSAQANKTTPPPKQHSKKGGESESTNQQNKKSE